MHDIVYLGDQSAKAEKSWHLSFQHFSQKLVSCIICNREWPLAQQLHTPKKIDWVLEITFVVCKVLNQSRHWSPLAGPELGKGSAWSHHWLQAKPHRIWQCQPTLDDAPCKAHRVKKMPQDSMPDWLTSRETASVVHTCLFYQACKVHDIVYLGDQSAKAEKSWHLSFQHFSQKLVSCIICNREWPSAQQLHLL